MRRNGSAGARPRVHAGSHGSAQITCPGLFFFPCRAGKAPHNPTADNDKHKQQDQKLRRAKGQVIHQFPDFFSGGGHTLLIANSRQLDILGQGFGFKDGLQSGKNGFQVAGQDGGGFGGALIFGDVEGARGGSVGWFVGGPDGEIGRASCRERV